MADLVAKSGQLRKPLSGARDFFMKNSTYYFKNI